MKAVAVLVLAASAAAAPPGRVGTQAAASSGALDRFVLVRTSDSAHEYPAGVPAPVMPVTVRLRIAVGADGHPRLVGTPEVAALDQGQGVVVPAGAVDVFTRAARDEVEQWRYRKPLADTAMLDLTLNYFPPSHPANAPRRPLVRVTPVVPAPIAKATRGFGLKGLISPDGLVTDLVVEGPGDVQDIARAAVAQWRYTAKSGSPVPLLTIMHLGSQ